MTHFYERNITEIKTEYTTYLINILTPIIYEGMVSVYKRALSQYNRLIEASKENPDYENPGLIKCFLFCLHEIPRLNPTQIENETKRIRDFSHCSEFFDDLVRAVIKSHIVLLTYNASGKTCRLVTKKYHESINVNDFIHKCYIECANAFFNNPEIFCSEASKEQSKIYEATAYKFINQSIINAIYKILPLREILQEYLSNDYIIQSHEHSKQAYENSFSLLDESKKHGALLESESDKPHESDIKEDFKEHIEKIIEKHISSDKNVEEKNIEKNISQVFDKKPEQISQSSSKGEETQPSRSDVLIQQIKQGGDDPQKEIIKPKPILNEEVPKTNHIPNDQEIDKFFDNYMNYPK